ncbi:uncharacterized protein G2W53_020507 [Senna tora]|uniref:Uncharacterized protein n=1 Tax=Senna tora TaxID=362788 RepID=A0A834TVY8_9FABA|nr:uncharacterized protein G2W53_020507 [Senna tora]
MAHETHETNANLGCMNTDTNTDNATW